MEHGSEVSLSAIIASVGPVTSRCSNQLPYCTSEICLKDPRSVWYTSYNNSYFIDIYWYIFVFLLSRIGFLRIIIDYDHMISGQLIGAELNNDFIIARRVRVNRDRGTFTRQVKSSYKNMKIEWKS
jgi:hypothetical protein